MSDYGLVWVDITPDFDPVDYADAFVDDEQADLIRESESVEDSLRALYEWGYLSKRDGRIQLLVPDTDDESLDEGARDKLRQAKLFVFGGRAGPGKKAPVMRAGWKKHAEKAGKAVAGTKAYKKTLGRMGTGMRQMAQGRKLKKASKAGTEIAKSMQKRGLKTFAKGAAPLAGAAAAGLGARALYKRMKKKKEQNETLSDHDLDDLLLFAEELGFDFETPEDIDETLEIGEYLDSVLEDAEADGLTEDFDEDYIIEAALDELEEAFSYEPALRGSNKMHGPKERLRSRMRRAPGKAYSAAKDRLSQVHAAGKSAMRGLAPDVHGPARKVGKARGAGRYVKGVWGSGKTGKAAVLGTGAAALGAGLAARALYKKMKKRKDKKESLDFDDLDFIIQDSIDLGFDFEDYDELVDALYAGEYIDSYLAEAEAEGLTEDTDESDIVLYALDDLDEAADFDKRGKLTRARDWLAAQRERAAGAAGRAKSRVSSAVRGSQFGKAHTRGKGYVAYTPGKLTRAQKAKEYAKGAWGGLNKKGKAAVIGTGIGAGLGTALAARAAYRKMKKRKEQKESLEFNGYRSSAEGGIYESAPIPFGTGNTLYESRIVDSLWDQR